MVSFSFSVVTSVLRRCAAMGLVFAGITPVFGGCNTCKYDEEQLPVVLCRPVPAGSAGCVGLPDGSTSSKTYPLDCEVISAAAGPSCGYENFACSAAAGNEKYAWGKSL